VIGDWSLPLNLARSERPSAFINFPVELHPELTAKKSFAEIRPRSLLSSIKYRVSSSSPRAICKDLRNSFVVPLPNPSAIFAATEELERLTCETIPN
jgi:hypothetical protein